MRLFLPLLLAGCATDPASFDPIAGDTPPEISLQPAADPAISTALDMHFGSVSLPPGVLADGAELADRNGDTTTLTDSDGVKFELTWRFGDLDEAYTLFKTVGSDVEPIGDDGRGFGALLPDDGDGRCVYVSGRDGVLLFQSRPMPVDDDCASFEDASPSLAEVDEVLVEADDPAAYSAWGTYVGTYNGVNAYSNGSTSYVGPYSTYGYQYQCVEYVNRYFVTAKGKSNMRGTGNANAYCSGRPSGITVYSNGGTTSPATGDFIVSRGGTYGHVAIVRSVSSSSIAVIQQNWSNSTSDNSKTLTLTRSGSNYTVGSFSSSYPVSCWGR